MNLAIDFNGVLCNRKNVPAEYKLGPPIKDAKQAMDGFKRQGHKLYIFTDMADTTEGYNAVSDWLEYFDIPWDYITNVKVRKLDYIIDDKAIRFTSWEQTLKELDTI